MGTKTLFISWLFIVIGVFGARYATNSPLELESLSTLAAIGLTAILILACYRWFIEPRLSSGE